MKVVLAAISGLLISSSSLALESTGGGLANKSLGVPGKNPYKFSVCVADQSIAQALEDTQQLWNIFASSSDLQQNPSMDASLNFFTSKVGDTKKHGFVLILTSLDTERGWQLVQDSEGQIVPYTTLVSNKAELKSSDGNAIGAVDLSACAAD